VASRVGVAAEVFTDGRDALLVPRGDAPDLAAATARLLDRPALRAELGQAAARLAHGRFTGARVAEKLVGHYRGLLAG